jgi:hypothetical protein
MDFIASAIKKAAICGFLTEARRFQNGQKRTDVRSKIPANRHYLVKSKIAARLVPALRHHPVFENRSVLPARDHPCPQDGAIDRLSLWLNVARTDARVNQYGSLRIVGV